MKPKPSEISQQSPTPNSTDSRNSRNASGKVSKMQNEPKPMINKKPVHKHPNAVDRFHGTHQAVYDESEKPAPNRCDYVHSHNDACPKLKDELAKRRDTSKPCASSITQATGVTQTFITELDWHDANCIMCSERKRNARLYSNRSRKRDRRPRYSRVSKSRRRAPQRRARMIFKSKSVQNKTPKDQDPKEIPKSKNDDDKSEKSEVIASTRSCSSYNSFLSLGHEPMDRI